MNKNKSKTSRQIQAENTKKKLMEVSLNLIKEQGFDNVKIEDICNVSGVSTGAFYHHIKSKAGIVVEGYSQCDDYFRDTVYPVLGERFDVDAILEYINYQMDYAQHMGVDICVQIYKAQLTQGTEFFLSNKRALASGLTALIARAQEHHVISSQKNAPQISHELLVISRGILYYWALNKGENDLNSSARDIILNYIQAYTL